MFVPRRTLKRDIRITFCNSILAVFLPRQKTIRLNLLKWQVKGTEILYLSAIGKLQKGKYLKAGCNNDQLFVRISTREMLESSCSFK